MVGASKQGANPIAIGNSRRRNKLRQSMWLINPAST